jgi:uncharacterized protein YigA (DUF484 family)
MTTNATQRVAAPHEQPENSANSLNQGGNTKTKSTENRDSTSVQRGFRATPNAESGCLQSFQPLNIEKPFCPTLMPEDVEAWLINHPDFFYERPLALIAVNLPSEHHNANNVKSLLQYQSKLLRTHLSSKQDQLLALSQNAHDNERRLNLMMSFAARAVAILQHQQHTWALTQLEDLLKETFSLDGARLYWAAGAKINKTFKTPKHQLDTAPTQALTALCEQGTWAGAVASLPEPVKTHFFQNTQTLVLASAAIVRIEAKTASNTTKTVGWMMLGSADETRFSADAGDVFLKHLAQLIAALLK